MKALSVSQPFVWSIFDPIADKDCENRSWAPPIALIGQWIAIHAAKSFIDDRVYQCQMHHSCELFTPIGYFLHHGITHAPNRRERYIASAIVGLAKIDRVVTEGRSLEPKTRRWFFGPYGWLIPERVLLKKPIPIGGKQGLWNVPVAIELEIKNQLGEVN